MNYSITDEKSISMDMKNNKLISGVLAFVFILMLIGSFVLGIAIAPSSTQVVQMEDGEMMIVTEGKAMAMYTEATINN